jgi:hypothetical protein
MPNSDNPVGGTDETFLLIHEETISCLKKIDGAGERLVCT